LEIVTTQNSFSKTDFNEKAEKLLTQYQNDLLFTYRSRAKILKRHRLKIHGYETLHWIGLWFIKPSSICN